MGKESITKIIETAAKEAAEAVVRCQHNALRTNHYKDMERLLRCYPTMRRIYDNAEDALAMPAERSKSITFASGGGFRDKQDIMEDVMSAKVKSWALSCQQFRWIDRVIAQFADRPEFIVIRMYYFGEDANGNEIGRKKVSFEEIAEELAMVGMERTERTLRQWRTQLVQDMAVCMFLVDGATSVGGGSVVRKE